MNKKKLSYEELIEVLENEEKKELPTLRKATLDILIKEYNVNNTVASRLIKNRPLINKMMEDPNWAEHMGPDYWAQYLYRNLRKHLRPSKISLKNSKNIPRKKGIKATKV
ncbi:hypothetical protein FPQ10_10490 [Allobacillus sp. SKP2-8]|uniref:hypothetical protein n=1 Tax=unclassified Allobacillus TaxID=2628859 RepID=UPI0011822CFE|nr:hypothetical protein [Allobacillus sp. SKP2-8]TSJ65005.1 hypothetical protein FPQ10_10490 [Allobacillus sp. SKP2-8]